MQSVDVTKGFVVDTGLLLIHATSIFEKGRLLKEAVTSLKIEKQEAEGFAKMIDRLFSSVKVILVTPYVLAELCNLAQSRLCLRDNKLLDFLKGYSDFLIKFKEWQCEKDELIAFKNSLRFCFTDSSVAFASKKEGMPLITIDQKLVRWCKSKGIEAKHAFYELYLLS